MSRRPQPSEIPPGRQSPAEVPHPPRKWPRFDLLAAAAISLWIILLHLLFLFHAGPLWRDEVGTIDFASMPTVADIWHNLQYDNFPPLFVGLARCWTLAAGSGDFGYRVLGFLVGLSALAVLWFSARQLGARVPLLVLALYAANPIALRVGDTMRPYGLGVALTVLAMALIWKFVENPRPRNLFCATLVAVLSVQCLYHNAVFLVAFSIAAWAVTLPRKQWKTAAQTLMIGGVAALSLLPHLTNLTKGHDWLQITRRVIHPGDIWSALLSALNASGAWMSWAWAALTVLALIVGLRGRHRLVNGNVFYCVTALVAGVALYAIFLWVLGLAPRSWYFLILLAPVALALDVILAGSNVPAIRGGRSWAAWLLILPCVPTCLAQAQWRQTNMDLVAATLRRHAHPGDFILVSPWYYAVSLQRYYGTNGFTTIPPMEEIRIHRYDLMKRQMESQNPIGPVADTVRETLHSGHAVWVVGVFEGPPPGRPQPRLPPYHRGVDLAESRYFSSWMFELSQIVQAHATSGGQVQIDVPGGDTINPLEDVPLMVFRGWKE